jgi:hypothetical protein|tara:strand:- start:245 stop:466 length:222 start_codon:yes stop_codon:yes gene_type:complete
MDRKVWVIESEQGFLKDVNVYTDEIESAVVFSTLQSAVNKFMTISGVMSSECWINSATMAFPRTTPYINILNK